MKKVGKRRKSSRRNLIGWLVFILLALLSLSACSGQETGPAPAPTSVAPTDAAPATSPLVSETPASETTAALPPTDSQPAVTAQLPDDATTQPVQEEAAALPTCTSPAALTPSMTEGPYYKSGSPERTSLLEEGVIGTRLVLTGYVLTEDCQPIANAWLDFWQADGQGAYDNANYRLRGHQLTDEMGRYRLETVVPGLYPGRTSHIHLKVQAPDGPVLTTQLFFPGEPGNQSDRIFSPQLLVVMQDAEDGKQATFDFILDAR